MKVNITSNAATRLIMRFPFWVEIFYSMIVRETTPEEEAAGLSTLATNGRELWVCASHFNGLTLDQQVAELVHELCHKIFLHCTRRGTRDPMLWNIACDYVVNAFMKRNDFTIGSDWLLDMKYDGWLAEAVYADLIKRQRENKKEGGGSGMPKLAPGRQDVKDQETHSPEQRERIEDEVKALVERCIANAKAMGTLPQGLEGPVHQVFKPSGEPWYNHLQRYMQALRVADYNWARLNRRALKTHGIFAPLHYAESLGDIVLFVDTSGSCFAAAQQARFADHVNAIFAEARPRKVYLNYFDAAVYEGGEYMAGELDIELRPEGGGGTSFVPLFDWVEEQGLTPDLVLVLTDMMGTYPETEPDYPVVWADVLGWKAAPFGETLRIDID